MIPAGFLLRYDATAPAIALLVPKAGKRSARLIRRTAPDVQSVELLRSPGLNGEAERVIFRG